MAEKKPMSFAGDLRSVLRLPSLGNLILSGFSPSVTHTHTHTHIELDDNGALGGYVIILKNRVFIFMKERESIVFV